MRDSTQSAFSFPDPPTWPGKHAPECFAARVLGPFSSLAAGVAHPSTAVRRPSPLFLLIPFRFHSPETVGVGHNEDPFSEMRRSDVSGADPHGFRMIPELLQAGPHLAQPAARAAFDVLDDDDPRPELADNSEVFVPKTGSGAVESCPAPSSADVLTWKATADDVDWSKNGRAN